MESLEAGMWYKDLYRPQEVPCASLGDRLRVHSRTVPIVTLGKGSEAAVVLRPWAGRDVESGSLILVQVPPGKCHIFGKVTLPEPLLPALKPEA